MTKNIYAPGSESLRFDDSSLRSAIRRSTPIDWHVDSDGKPHYLGRFWDAGYGGVPPFPEGAVVEIEDNQVVVGFFEPWSNTKKYPVLESNQGKVRVQVEGSEVTAIGVPSQRKFAHLTLLAESMHATTDAVSSVGELTGPKVNVVGTVKSWPEDIDNHLSHRKFAKIDIELADEVVIQVAFGRTVNVSPGTRLRIEGVLSAIRAFELTEDVDRGLIKFHWRISLNESVAGQYNYSCNWLEPISWCGSFSDALDTSHIDPLAIIEMVCDGASADYWHSDPRKGRFRKLTAFGGMWEFNAAESVSIWCPPVEKGVDKLWGTQLAAVDGVFTDQPVFPRMGKPPRNAGQKVEIAMKIEGMSTFWSLNDGTQIRALHGDIDGNPASLLVAFTDENEGWNLGSYFIGTAVRVWDRHRPTAIRLHAIEEEPLALNDGSASEKY